MLRNRVSKLGFAVCALLALNSCIGASDGTDDPDLASLSENLALPAPTNVTAVAVSPTRIDVHWDAVVGDLKYYIVDRGPALGAEVTLTSVAPTTTTWISNNLTPSTQYCWDVRTVTNSNEVSGKSNEVCATTQATVQTQAPTNVTATAISASRITVAWDAVPGATVYHVFMAQSAPTPTFSQIASVTTTSTTIANLLPATTYLFEVSAVTPGGESARSNPVSATTFQLGLEGYWKFDELTGTVAKDSSGFARDATLTGASFSTAALPPVNLNNKSELALTADPTSGGSVAQAGAFRFGGATFTLSTWIKLGAATPTDFIGIRAANCGTVGWKLGQDATNQLNLQSGAGGTRSFGTSLAPGVWTHVAFTYNEATTTLVLYLNGAQVATSSFSPANPLGAAVPVTFGHAGGCAGGAAQLDELQIFSRALSAAEIARLGKVPPATTLSITVNNASTATLSWTAVPGVDLYYVYKGTAAGNETFFTSVSGASLSFVGQHLSPLATNTWFVRATTGGTPYSTSNEVSSTTPDVLPAPATLTATPVNATRINVAWAAVPGAVSYRVLQSTDGGQTFTQVGRIFAPTVTQQIANLTTKTTYTYEVRAVDAGGNDGHLTAPVSATTP